MVVGLAALAAMALPALGRHANVGRSALHAGHAATLAPVRAAAALVPVRGTAAAQGALVHATPTGMTRFLPSPRLVFSLLALYGAFGNVLLAVHLAPLWAGLVAIVPAAIVERFAVTPVWRLLFRFQGHPSAPLETIVMSDATAVTGFRNGRGVVSVVRDGRLVQFSARLIDAQAHLDVRVGDSLRVEDVDPARERVTVSGSGGVECARASVTPRSSPCQSRCRSSSPGPPSSQFSY